MSDFRTEVAAEMIRQIEAGAAPWQKPWQPGVIRTAPFNPASGRDYRGINAWWLEMQGRGDPRWLTYKQAAALDAQVRKGERGTTVQYWQWTRDEPRRDAAGQPVLGEDGKPETVRVRLDKPHVFTARVFNAEQIDGLAPLVVPEPAFTLVEAAERTLAAAGVAIHHDQSDRAFYRPATDAIHLPPPAAFAAAYEYYATALHEVGHATGHRSRLDRPGGPFGSRDYAIEELRAEMASFMLTTELGLGHYPERHAGYVESWLKAVQDDHGLLFRAARDADVIRQWVLEPEKRPELERTARGKTPEPTREPVHPVATPAPEPSPPQETAMLQAPAPRTAADYQVMIDSALPALHPFADEALARLTAEFADLPYMRADRQEIAAGWAEIALPAEAAEKLLADAAIASDWPARIAERLDLDGPADFRALARDLAACRYDPKAIERTAPLVDQVVARSPRHVELLSTLWDHLGPDLRWRFDEYIPLRQRQDPVIAGLATDPYGATLTALGVSPSPPAATQSQEAAMPQDLPRELASLPGYRMTYNDRPGQAGAEVLDPDNKLIAFGGRPAVEAFITEHSLSPEDAAALRSLDARADQHRAQPQYPELAAERSAQEPPRALASLPGHFAIYSNLPGQEGVEVLTPTDKLIGFGGRPAVEAFITEHSLSPEDATALRALDARADQHRAQPQYPELAAERTAAAPRLTTAQAIRMADAANATLSDYGEAPAGSPQRRAAWDALARAVTVLEDAGIHPKDAVYRPGSYQHLLAEPAPAREGRTYLAVPYAEKEEAKALGARWDRKAKSWYAPEDVDLQPLSRWQAKAPAAAPALTPEQEFTQACKAHGLALPGAPVMDGRWHRAALAGDRKGEMNGSYRGFMDGHPAGQITNYKSGQTVQWVATGQALTPEARAALAAEAATRRAEREAEIRARADQAAALAAEMWRARRPVSDHPYLSRKGITPPQPLGQDADGNLLIPMHDATGTLRNLQTISPEGEKRYLKGGQKQGLYHLIDPAGLAGGTGPLLIAEGYATASTLHQATGLPVAVAFDAGNLAAVAEALHAASPRAFLVIAADDDHGLPAKGLPNTGLEKAAAAAAAVGGSILPPPFTEAEKARGLTDWNDLFLARGEKGLAAAINQAEALLALDQAPRIRTPDKAPPTRAARQDRASSMAAGMSTGMTM